MTAPNIEIQREFSERLTIHKNLAQEVVVTTVDKVRLCLMDNRDCLLSKKEWVTPASVFATLITTLVAADFHDFIVKAPTWQALYILATLGSGAWLATAAIRGWRHRHRGSIDDIVASLKANTQQVTTTTAGT
jgi:hypothetical protein